MLVWATTFVVSADALTTISPAVLTVLRFVLAAITLVPLALWRRAPLGSITLHPAAALLGLTGVAAYYGLQNIGLLLTTAGTAALLQALLPIVTALLAAAFLGERPPPRVVVGLGVATVGVGLVASAGGRLDAGALLIMVGVVSYAAYTVALRHFAGRPRFTPDPLAVAATSSLWGVLFLAPWLGWETITGQSRWPTSAAAVGATLYLGVVASGGTLLLWSYGAARIPASISGVLTAGIPAFGYAFAVLFGEPATWIQTTGGTLAVCGIVIATQASSRLGPTKQEPRPG